MVELNDLRELGLLGVFSAVDIAFSEGRNRFVDGEIATDERKGERDERNKKRLPTGMGGGEIVGEGRN